MSAWPTAPLREVVDYPVARVVPEAAPERPFTYIDISAADADRKVIVAPRTILGREAPSRARQQVLPADVLVSTTRPNLNAVAKVPPELAGAIASTGFAVLRPRAGLDADYLLHWTRSPSFVAAVSAMVQGALYPAVTDRQVLDLRIPLPPLDEQRRIAARLGDQLSATDALRLGIERRLETIAHVHSEVLASTFARIHASAVALGAAVSQPGAIADGPFGSHLKTEHYARSGVRVIRLQNIGSGTFIDHDRAFVTREHADTLTRHMALEGDVVVAALGDGARPAGRACQVPDIGPALVKADCFRVRTDSSPVDPGFLVWFLNSPLPQAMIAGQMRGATRPRVTLAMLKAFAIPLPPLAEQRRIAARLREQLAEIDRAKTALDAQRNAIAALPAALLREVFGPAQSLDG
ncbi:MAG TPA: restriction endonuclease subunit S [Coriobacteriia bacterium]